MATFSKVIGINILVFLTCLLLIEAPLQIVAFLYPSYKVIFLQPDRKLGWKQFPNHNWTWAGWHWYATDFSVNVETNPSGFRDTIHKHKKPHGVKRVALIGDSFVEAVQVPFKRTAGQLLQKSLNSLSKQKSQQFNQWEVLNFGISNYGVGQYLLTWEEYAQKFNPDYVAIFVAKFHMNRTVSNYEYGAFSATKRVALHIRPGFRLENDKLIREPAKDFDEFVKVQKELMSKEFLGKKSYKNRQLITYYYAKKIYRKARAIFSKKALESSKPNTTDQTAMLATNLRIIKELGEQVERAGSKLIVIDVSQYFGDSKAISRALKDSCYKNNFGYIPLYNDLIKANKNGDSTRWQYDGHFNELGNEIMAESLRVWVTQHENQNILR